MQHGRKGHGHAAAGETLAAITDALVQLRRRYYGKGPRQAKSYAINDTIVCILHGGFTDVERTLIDSGDAAAVYGVRRSFQVVMEDEFRGVVERLVGRSVIAYMSQAHTNPDIAVELFVLEPEAGLKPSEHVERPDQAPEGHG